MEIVFIIFVAIIIILFLISVLDRLDKEDRSVNSFRSDWIILDPAKRAGRNAEKRITGAIRSALYDDDFLITNVNIAHGDREAELDNVIVNSYGVFIIEVKYYSGRLEGNENDFEWTKYHTSAGNNTYTKTVKNPIKQVKRQINILAKYLEDNGVRVWVEGYVIMMENNSPVESDLLLKNIEEVRKVLHNSGRQILNNSTRKRIIELLSKN